MGTLHALADAPHGPTFDEVREALDDRGLLPGWVNGHRQFNAHCPAHRASLNARDTALVSVFAYAGLRPAEALALQWKDIGERTIHVERANDDGTLKSTKTGRSRSVRLMTPLRHDLNAWRLASGRPDDDALIFPNASGELWREHDWRNWRRRIFQPIAKPLGITRPYDLRHSAASLWLQEGQSVVQVAAWLGHAPSVCLDTYGHIVEELRDAPGQDAEQAIRAARDVPTVYPRETANA